MKTSYLFNYPQVKLYMLGEHGLKGLGSNHSPEHIAKGCLDV